MTENSREYSSELIYSRLVSSGKAGGRRFSFASFSVSGNKKNKVGLGYGKSTQSGLSIKKSISNSIKNAEYFPFGNSVTIPFEVKGKYKNSIVILKPCSKYNGLKAGGVVRKILSLLGIQNVTSKVVGSKHARNVALSTFVALHKISEYKKIFDNRKLAKDEFNN